MCSDAFAVEIASQLDLTKWFADVAPAEIAQHPSYKDMLRSLTAIMGAANFAIDNADRGIHPEQFRTLIQALQELDSCADRLDAVVTNSLTDVDALTGLFNRAALDRDLNREVAKAKRTGSNGA